MIKADETTVENKELKRELADVRLILHQTQTRNHKLGSVMW